jgi:hypothetical protein
MGTEEKIAAASIGHVVKDKKRTLEVALEAVFDSFLESTGLEVAGIKIEKLYTNGFDFGAYKHNITVTLKLWE